MERKKYLKIQFWFVLLLIVAVSTFLIFYDPVAVIESLGLHEGYFVSFIISLFAGISVFTSAFFYSSIVLFVTNGFNFLILGLVSGFGLFIGDSFVFYFGKKGREAFDFDKHPRIEKFSKWLVKQSRLKVSVVIVLYGLLPVPNDLLMLALSVLGYSYRKVIVPLILADIAIVTFAGYLAMVGKGLF